MATRQTLTLMLVIGLVAGSCGSDDDGPVDSSPTVTTTVVETTVPPTTTTAPVPADQLAIWPANDVVFSTPEEAAADFVAGALQVPPELGAFRSGDARSGEIEVLSLGEGGTADPPLVRSVLLLRQLGPDDGWFVIAAVSDNATIASPESMAAVPSGPIDVTGRARGFEGTVLVSAFSAGDAGTRFDQVIGAGGAAAATEPYAVSVDLSEATVGAVVTLLVRGGTGLETDPGDFSAIPVVITP